MLWWKIDILVNKIVQIKYKLNEIKSETINNVIDIRTAKNNFEVFQSIVVHMQIER